MAILARRFSLPWFPPWCGLRSCFGATGWIKGPLGPSLFVPLLGQSWSSGQQEWHSFQGTWQQVSEFGGKELKPTFLGDFAKKGIEVLHMVDPVDKFSAQREKEFDGKQLTPTFLEDLVNVGIEALHLVDPVDELSAQQVNQFDGQQLKPTVPVDSVEMGIVVLHIVDTVDELAVQRMKEFDSKMPSRPPSRPCASRSRTWGIPSTSLPCSR